MAVAQGLIFLPSFVGHFIIISAMTKQKKIYLKPVKNNNYGLFHIIFCYFDRGITLTRMTTTKIEVLLLRFQLVHLVQNVYCEALLYFVLEDK